MDNYLYQQIEEEKLKYQKWADEKSIKLEVGKVYLQKSESWAMRYYKIIFADDKIAIGQVVYCGIYKSSVQGCGGYELFLVNTGEKYQDKRLNYALIKEV